MLHDTGVQPLQGREDLLPHADAEESRVAIRWIEAVRNAVTLDVGVDVAPPGLEHRADAFPVAGRHHGETPGGGAAKEAHEKSLGAVVGVVPRRDPRGAEGGPRVAKGLPPGGAGARLQVPSRAHADARAREGHVELLGKGGRAIELRLRLGSQAVVDAVGEQAEAELAS